MIGPSDEGHTTPDSALREATDKTVELVWESKCDNWLVFKRFVSDGSPAGVFGISRRL
jgi:hypothetical protein